MRLKHRLKVPLSAGVLWAASQPRVFHRIAAARYLAVYQTRIPRAFVSGAEA